MDFFNISMKQVEQGPDKGQLVIFPDFIVGRSKDLMVRGRSFYAVWDEKKGLWSTDEYDVQRLVDEAVDVYAAEYQRKTGESCKVKHLRSSSSGLWYQFRKFMQNISDNSRDLDDDLTFANTDVKKSDYASKRLGYPLVQGDCSAWDELIGTLYSVEERAKIEWAIGAIVAGDAKKIQKFLVLYGPAGTGKSTILNIIQKLFEGYVATFEAKALGSNGNQFATEAFKNNPLVGIQHDGDLSKIEDNTVLNSVISHEVMRMNEKYKAGYDAKVNAFLFMGTNQPVRISDAKSGIIRRLIDVHPTGVKIPANHYFSLMAKIDFELGAIAHHCLEVYRAMGKNFYNGYRPTEMMLQTDVFFNFIEANYDVFKSQDGATLKQAYALYKEFCNDTGIDRQLPQYKVREELRNYFDEFHDRATVEGHVVRSYYEGFNANKFKTPTKEANTFSLVIEETKSLLDEEFADCPAQYGNAQENPRYYWDDSERMIDDELKKPKSNQIVKTTLSDIDTHELHFVKVPKNHIVIDFDLKDENGEKSLERNLEAASTWPATYAELSKGGAGVHLHYNYDGDVEALGSVYSEGIEVKTLLGNASLRRRLSKCNNIPIATMRSGILPVKEKKMQSERTLQSEKGLRDLIERNLRKEIHPGTKPSVDFIKKILDDAYNEGMTFDVSDLKPRLVAFANNSSNQALACIKLVQQMRFQGREGSSDSQATGAVDSPEVAAAEDPIVFYDVEVYPNLFVICWKYLDGEQVVRMINPTAAEVEQLFKLKLVGYNCRRYDNHILYARYMGYNNEQLYQLSQKIISGNNAAMFGEAYNISYADIYDFSSKKQSLKKFEIELGLHHMEMEIPWDLSVPEELWGKVVDYCVNDVLATEATFKARKQDFVARQILADLSGLTINDTTQKHTARIIFGKDRNPQARFRYTDLSDKLFPGYEFDRGKSTYRDEVVGEGGYVYAEPGMYENVVLLDVASMHPTSIIQLDMFGEYTPNFKDLLDARLAIKKRDFASARKMLDGRLKPYLQDEGAAKELSYALKIVINIVYGLTSARFENPFRDPLNKDNIVAKRGALFMIDLKHFVQERGFTVAHIKTDSIKIPNATPEIIEEVTQFGKDFGYDFEHEATYDKFCLVNDAVYIAGTLLPDDSKPAYNEDGVRVGKYKWTAVGAQFQHPYVFKKLFTNEPVTFDDLCETKQVTKGAMYLDFEHDKPLAMVDNMHFVGRIGRFTPVTQNSGGAVLYRVVDDKLFAVTGTKGYLWMESDMAKDVSQEPKVEIDMGYFEMLADEAKKAINKFGDFNEFVS